MREVFRPVVRLWLEVVLPLYAVACLIIWFRPQYLPPVLQQDAGESLWPLMVWSTVGAMFGILGLSGLFVVFFLLYWDTTAFLVAFVLFAGCGPMLWRLLV